MPDERAQAREILRHTVAFGNDQKDGEKADESLSSRAGQLTPISHV